MSRMIKLTAGDGFVLDAYVADPKGKPKGGLVVVQEIFGVNQHIRAVTDRFAQEGYLTVAPAIFDRVQTNVELGYNGPDMQQGFAIAQKLNIEDVVKDVDAALHYAAAETGKPAGVVGYCFGGTLAWLSATRLAPAAAVGYYGGWIAKFAAEEPKAPVMLHFGKHDDHIPASDVAKVQDAHPEVPIYWYDAGHGFNCDMRGSYDEKAAKEAWGEPWHSSSSTSEAFAVSLGDNRHRPRIYQSSKSNHLRGRRRMAESAASYAWKPKTNPWLIAATVALAAFMEVLDTSIANVALPHIAGSLGASADQSTWVLTSYLVSNAIVLPMGAWAASVIGRKNFFMLCIVIFTVSSFLCGLAPSLGLLLLFRIFQGMGGGGLQPMAQAIMADSFEPSKRGLAFSLYGLVAVLAPSIGPTLGGWITDNYSWNWIFYINIPVGILALFLTNRLVEDPPWGKHDRKNFYRIDYIGVGFLTIAMGALQVTLDKGEEKDWFGSNFIVGFALTFIVSFIALIAWEFHVKNPVMDLRLFKFRNFAVCAFLMLLTGGLLNATTVLQPQFLQSQLGYTATIAGLSLSGGGLALLVLMPMAGQAIGRFPARNLIAFGFVLFSFSYFYTATHISLLISFGFSSWIRVLQIAAIPFVFISVTTAAYFGLPAEKNNQVAGLINFVRNIGGSILIALTNALVTERSQWHQNALSKNTTLAGSNYQQQIDALRHTFDVSAGKANGLHLAQGQIYEQLQAQTQALAYVDVYYVLAFASVLMIPMAFLLTRNRPGGGGAVMME